MVIWPKSINKNDGEWLRACALMQVLALNPRQESKRVRKPRETLKTADDYLFRPLVWIERKQVPAAHYSFSLRFNVSASVHGTIPVDDVDQIEEFKRVVNAALQGALTEAERNRWAADEAFRKSCSANDGMADGFHTLCGDEGRKADHFYLTAKESIEVSRRNTGWVGASLSNHDEILVELIRVGTDLISASFGNSQ